MSTRIRAHARIESWPLAAEFRIARGAKREARVVVVELDDGCHQGRGECLPYARYQETPEATLAVIQQLFAGDRQGIAESRLLQPTGCASADNALDCALWDLQAQRQGRPVWELAGLARPQACTTAYTITIAEPREMQQAAADNAARPLLKIKLGGADAQRDGERLQAVRLGAPDADLIVDANEGWTQAQLQRFGVLAADLGVSLLEQPLPADADDALLNLGLPVAIGADESVHGLDDLALLRRKYQVLNIKLDKTGGLTRALELLRAAQALEFEIMIGCMVATSLSMAPALLLADQARFVDLDGPLLLREDRAGGLDYQGSRVSWPAHACWGESRAASGGS